MNTYKHNPKTEGSGIICCIPQQGRCPINCPDCFFQNGGSYLGNLDENLPNLPPDDLVDKYVVRVNDGNDSNIDKKEVLWVTSHFPHRFYNTSIPNLEFPAPVVLTVNPAKLTDVGFHKIEPIPKNLMFVRVRTNMWNLLNVVKPAVEWYTSRGVPVVLTFMAYTTIPIPFEYENYYVYRKRTINSYYAIRPDTWKMVMNMFHKNDLVYSCGESENGTIKCSLCGNCMREYWNAYYRMDNDLEQTIR